MVFFIAMENWERKIILLKSNSTNESDCEKVDSIIVKGAIILLSQFLFMFL